MPDITIDESIAFIGDLTERIDGRQLPTNRQVLSVFFYNHTLLKLDVRQSANEAIKQTELFWSQAQIPAIKFKRSVFKLECLFFEWKNILKNRSRRNSVAQTLRARNYEVKLDQLFDIAHLRSETLLSGNEQRFLMDQRSTRHSNIMETVGNKTIVTDASMPHDTNDPIVENDPTENHSDCSELTTSLSQLSTASSMKRTISNFEDEMSDDNEPKPKKINIMTPDLAAALDRTNTSSRNAVYIIAATAAALGHNVNDINMSASVIHRQRIKLRTEMARDIQKYCKASNCLVVHWDGKLLAEITGSGNVERLPVVVSGVNTEQLLGVPKLPSGTGANQATIVVELLKQWNFSHRIKAMCFDTTSTNTGRIKGACVLLEQKLERNLLHLACRHHVYELLLRSVVEIYWPITTGPNVPVFKRFQSHWADIDQLQYKTGIEDEYVAETISTRKEDILNFILGQFKVSQPRDDYKEFLELACVFLGGELPRGIRFKSPGAMHHARWLSKAIYCLKMFLFREQFPLKARESNGLKHICIFIIYFYVESWFNAPSAIKAPNHDLILLQRLIKYQNVNTQVAKAASSKLAGHLWYLSEELAPLSFFDDSVPLDVKRKMVQAIHDRESSGRNVRPVLKEKCSEAELLSRDISDFVTKNSLFIFKQFELNCDFLKKAPELWDIDETYQDCLSVFTQLKVVNDTAERGVALIEKYNDSLTKDEDQKQYLLRIVSNHRQQYPNPNKSTLTR